VIEHSADFGIAFDGDGDRLAMADGDGTLFDGDQLLYAMVKHRQGEQRLRGGVVGTLMTNFALERRLAEMGVAFARAKVGDRYVLETLLERGWECGGENSGHLLCLDCHTTGDAMISALQVLAAVGTRARPGAYTRELTLLPQVLVNVKLAGTPACRRPGPGDRERPRRPRRRGRVLLRLGHRARRGARHGRGRGPGPRAALGRSIATLVKAARTARAAIEATPFRGKISVLRVRCGRKRSSELEAQRKLANEAL
jgi:phosphoglucosamine mutase